MLTFHKVSFSYALGNSWNPIFRQASLVLPSQGLFLIQGENGVGKTTLFKLIHGECQPQSGHIQKFNEKKFFAAWMKQHPIFLSHLRMHEHWSLLKNMIHPSQWNSPIEKDLFKIFDMNSLNNHLVSTLSGGEKQRLQFMMTYMIPAPVYLLDEPTTALDSKNKAIMVEWIVRLSKHALVLVITHDPTLFQTSMDGCITINDHRLHIHRNHALPSSSQGKIVQPKKIKLIPRFVGMKAPVIPFHFTSWIPYVGILIVLALLWFQSSFDAAMFQWIVGQPQTLFVQAQIRQSEPIEGTPFVWANYRELTFEEQPNITDRVSNTFFLPNYSHLMEPFIDIDHQVWTFLPYDDRLDIEPVVYASHPIHLETISIPSQATSINALSIHARSISSFTLLPQPPTLYFPYFWLKESFINQGLNVYETTQYWWVIPASVFHRQTYETIRKIEDFTSIVFHHALIVELQLVDESRPLIQGLLSIFGLVYSLGWMILGGFIFERRWKANKLLRQWHWQFPFGKEYMHSVWKLWIVYDWFFFVLVVGSFFLMMVFILNWLNIPWLIQYEPWLLVCWLIGNGLFRSTLYEGLSLQHD